LALSTAEIARIKFELGYNILTVGAEPYISWVNLFDQIVAPNLPAGAATTSSTSVAAATSPALVTLVLALATGFAAGGRVWIGVDDNLETATIQSLSGTSMAVSLQKAHSGTYQVYMDSGEAMAREILEKIKATKVRLGLTFGGGGLKKVDEIEFWQTGSKTLFGNIGDELMFWRDELASLLGVFNAWRGKSAAGSSIAVY
jgi:hypothetical protein